MGVSRFFFLRVALTSLLFAASASHSALRAQNQPPPTSAQPEKSDFEKLFMPFRTERAALSPDGKHLAYTLREGENLSVVVVEVDNPGKAKAKVTVVTDEAATPMMEVHAVEKTPGAIRWMRWITDARLVVETNRCFPFNVDAGDVGNWYNSVGEIIAFDLDGKNPKHLATPRDLIENLPAAGNKSNSIHRSPHIVDISEDDPNAIVIQAEGVPRESGLRYIERFKIDITTGKISSMESHAVSVERSHLFDRKGTPRISVPVTTRDSFPHRFQLEPTSLFKRGKPIEQIAADGSLHGFELSPANYFSERSVPLGFGKDPDVLYYASNVGRDTFGLYSVDLKTGKRTGFQAESPVFDLYAPSPGIYPDTLGGSTRRDSGADSLMSPAEGSEAFNEADASSLLPSANASAAAADQQRSASDTQMAALDELQYSSKTLARRVSAMTQNSGMLGNHDLAPLLVDRFTHDVVGFRYEGRTFTCTWFNQELARAQNGLEAQFPGRSVDLLEWDRSYSRFLVRVRGIVDSGAFYIYDTKNSRLMEFVQRAPILGRENLHQVTTFEFKSESGQTTSGNITFPKSPRVIPVPTIIVCQPQPWARVHADFQPEIQAFAEMGFAVVQVNARGAWGFGIKQRETATGHYEEGQVEDFVRAIDHLARRFAINTKRVAVIGKSHGAHLALRALQLQPQRFRCAVALDPVLDIKSWLQEARWKKGDARPLLISSYFGDPKKLPDSPLLEQPQAITKPVLFLSYRGEAGRESDVSYLRAKNLRSALVGNGVECELHDLSADFMSGLPHAKTEAFKKIEDFLNVHIYNYKVKSGELKQIKD